MHTHRHDVTVHRTASCQYEAILSTLQAAAEIHSGRGASEAAGLLTKVKSFNFIILLHIMEKLLG